MKRSAAAVLAGCAVGAMLVGCSPSVTGGDTACKDFLSADEATQNEAVSKMLKDEKGTDAAQLEISGTRLAVQTWCQTLGTPDSEIKQAPHL